MSIKPEIQEFFVQGYNEDTSHVLLHIAEPMTEEEKKRGYFFALIELKNSFPEQLEQIQQIINDIETQYYESSNNGEDIFEKILQHTNSRSTDILNYDNTQVHSIVGILQDKKLILAYHGLPQASLFYQTPDGLSQAPIIEEDTNQHAQLFSTVVEGSVNEDDYIYICTPHVNEFFPADRVKKILTSRTTRQSTMHIQKVLDSLKNEYSFGGVLFHIPKQPITPMVEIQRRRNASIGSQESMDNFLHTTKSTEETLSPPMLKNAKLRVKNVLSRFTKNDTQISTQKNQQRNDTNVSKPVSSIETNYRSPSIAEDSVTNKILISLGKALVFLVTGIYIIIKKLVGILIIATKNVFFIITNKDGKRTLIADQGRDYIKNKKQQIQHLGIISKVLFIALICLALIFIGSITYIKIKENKEAQIAQYNNTITIITEKKDEAEAHLLYGEETKALEILQEAGRLTETLPQKTEDEIAKVEDLKEQLSVLLLKLQKITSVDSPLVVDLLSTNQNAHVTQMVLLHDTLIAYGLDDTAIYSIDPVTQQVEIKNHQMITQLSAADVPKENNKITFINQQNNVIEFNSDTQSFSTKDISYSVDEPAVKDLAIYNTRVYTLSAIHEQLFKHNPTQTGYDKGTPWIVNKEDSLSKAVSVAVDGDIYILTSEGKILKFYANTQQKFQITGLDPALENPTHMWTYSDVNNLYILEPTHKRVVIIDKEGNFIGQYTNEQWNDLQDFVINETEKTIFVLSGNKIYSFKF